MVAEVTTQTSNQDEQSRITTDLRRGWALCHRQSGLQTTIRPNRYYVESTDVIVAEIVAATVATNTGYSRATITDMMNINICGYGFTHIYAY